MDVSCETNEDVTLLSVCFREAVLVVLHRVEGLDVVNAVVAVAVASALPLHQAVDNRALFFVHKEKNKQEKTALCLTFNSLD